MIAKNPNTFRELIKSIINTYQDTTFRFNQSSVTEVNDTYFVEVIWGSETTELDSPSSNKPLPIQEGSEYKVQPKFSYSKKSGEEPHGGAKNGVHRLNYKNKINERNLDKLELICSEVTLSETEFIEFVEQVEAPGEVVEIVEVSSFRREEEYTANIFSSLLVEGDMDDIRPNLDHDIHFNMNLRIPEGHVMEESDLMPSSRFDHVDRITIGGTPYPVTIKTRPTEDTTGGSGQIIHISDFAQENTPMAPKIKISDEIERIDWGEFLSSNDTWPDGPGLAIHRP